MAHRLRALFFTLFLAVGCGDTCSKAEVDEEQTDCQSDAECDDGLYCNGFERCDPFDPFASRTGCVPGVTCAPASLSVADGKVTCRYPEREAELAECFRLGDEDMCCTTVGCLMDSDCDDRNFCNGTETCVSGRCESGTPPPEDADGDGVDAIYCGGNDCDDEDASIAPGNPEVCDEAGVDEDCDASTIGPDVDGDGFAPLECCNGDNCGTDCDDNLSGVNPGAVEICNGRDDNCDGDIDEMLRQTFYADTDGDGFGDASAEQVGCFDTIGSGYSLIAGDCDDTNPQIFPGSIVCDPQPNDPNAYLFCETDGTYSNGKCDVQTEACVAQPGGHGVCTRP